MGGKDAFDLADADEEGVLQLPVGREGGNKAFTQGEEAALSQVVRHLEGVLRPSGGNEVRVPRPGQCQAEKEQPL